jgi:hypothetical protein
LNEGDGYRVEVDIPDGAVTLVATVSPPRFDRLSLERGAAVVVRVEPGDVHLLGTRE